MDPPSWARGEDAAPVHAAPDHAAPSHQAGDHDADAEASAPSTTAINGPGHGRVKALGLNVRSSPHAGSRDNILGTLRRGDQIEIIGRDGVWLQITYHGQPAYVHSGYVEREVAAPAAASGLEPGGPSQRQDGNPASIGPTQDVTSPPASISDAQSGDDALPPRELVSPYDYPGMSEILATDESRVTVAPVETGDKAGGGKGKKAETETGIATGIALDRFITAAHDVQTNWASLDKNTRGQKLGDAANTELDAVGVPKVGIVNKDLGEINGQLDFTPWNLDLNGTRFESPTTTSERMAPIARTVYHESRHAEQWFRMARIEAGQGKNAAAIASKLEIKPEVAAAAESKPLTGDSQEAKEAAAWHKSVYGADREARNTTLTNVSIHAKRMGDASAKSDAAEREYDRLRADTTASADDKKSALAAWKAAFAAYNAAKMTFNASYAAYTALPEEADAWKLGDRVMTAYKSK
jgi:hypothetical protein